MHPRRSFITPVAALIIFAGAIAAVTLAASGARPAAGAPPASQAAQLIAGRYIVTFKQGVDPDQYSVQLAARLGFSRGQVYRSALKGFAADLPDSVVQSLRNDPNVQSVEQDQLMRALPASAPIAAPARPANSTTAQTLPTGIMRAQSDQNAAASMDGVDNPLNVDVAVIDTGIDTTHPELTVAGGTVFNNNLTCTTFFGITRCRGRCGITSGSFNDDNGHGSHVSGIIAARDNGAGVVGMAPGARLWAVKVLSASGIGCNSDVIAGADWVTDQVVNHGSNISVANMSLGGGGSSATLCTAIANSITAGVVYAVAAGNSNLDAGGDSPANCAGAITVSALADYNGAPGGGAAATCANYGPDDSLASFSNFGSVVAIAAPGVCIYSTYMNGGYATLSGTSMASPHVAGAAALDVLVNGKPLNATGVANVRSRLIASGFPQGSACGFTGDKDSFHEPLLNVGPACSGTPPTPAPTATTPGGATATPTSTPTATATSTGTTVHVASINLSSVSTSFGLCRTVTGAVTIVNQSNSAVSGAAVSAPWTLPSGSTSPASATTNASGVATMSVQVCFSNITGIYTLTVNQVSGSGLTYNPGANVVTAKSITVN